MATDRYRPAVRALRPGSVAGDSRQVLVPAADMTDVAARAVRLQDVEIERDRQGARLRSGRDTKPLPTVDETFLDHQVILGSLPTARHRVITGRGPLRSALARTGRDERPVTLHTDDQQLALACPGSAGTTLPALCTGAPLRISFDPEVLLPALDAGVGPDVLLEISSPTRPVVVRSADQGSFTTLVMPVHDAPAGA
ncbi:hypothetical protein [Streptomyces sp. NPDC048650]|uniref:hypothetical protein n=1 Tax=unclassified Streptomyces TaxID=2593676 RepID=UPI00371E4781